MWLRKQPVGRRYSEGTDEIVITIHRYNVYVEFKILKIFYIEIHIIIKTIVV